MQIKSSDSKEVKISKKEIKESKRLLKIATDRAGEENALRFDITSFNPLFERKQMVEGTEKSLLTKELEAAHLTPEFYETGTIPISTGVIVDFMSFIRGEVIKASDI